MGCGAAALHKVGSSEDSCTIENVHDSWDSQLSVYFTIKMFSCQSVVCYQDAGS